MDILAAIASDPTFLPLWAVLLFAAGMYPIGMMFGCSPCCDPCICSSGESLPETITVTLNGFTDYSKKQICTLSFSACYGSGGSGTVDAPGQSVPESDPVDDRGPITAVTLADGGSGYAKLGRAAPTVSVTGTSGSGTGATFNVTLASSKDSCGLDRWAVSKVTATGGSGYQTGDTLTFAVAEGDTQEQYAIATLYAARVAPTVTVTGTSGSGTGATFSVTLAQSQDSNGFDRWAVSKVVRTGGTGYANGDALTFAIAEGDTQEVEAAATIAGTTYAEPTLSLSVSGGTGAVLQIDGYTKSGDTWGLDFADTWRISGITVANGGSGYTDNTLVTVNLGQGDEARPGAGSNLRVRTGFRAPADEWSLEDGSVPQTGDGLVLSLTMEVSPTSSTTWRVASWAIIDGGSGYGVGQRIRPDSFEVNSHPSPLRANLQITAVDSGGAVTEIDLVGTTTSTRNTSRGRYAVDSGVITSVENLFAQAGWRKVITNSDGVVVTNGGFYYREDASNRTVVVNAGGRYYREDASLPPYVATVTVNINQGNNTPSAGTGAVITATVEDDPQSPDFGVITGLAVQNGGDDYLAWVWETNDCCGHYLNGQSIVLARFKDSNAAACQAATKDFLGQYNVGFSADGQYYSVPSDCVYTTQFCGGWVSPFLNGLSFYHQQQNSKLQLYVGYRGEGQRPVAKLGPHCYGGIGSDGGWLGCHQDWIADEPIESCSQLSFSATPSGRPSISVTPGGTYESDWRFAGCDASGACPSCNVCCQGSDEPPEEIEIHWSDQWAGLSLPDYGQVIAPRPNNLADTSGTYVLQKSSATRWAGYFQHLAFDVGTTPGICGCVGDGCCEECIKKCSVRLFHMRIGTSYTTGQADNFLSDERFGSYGQYNFANCSVCNETPMCRPPPGLEIPIIVERIIVPLGFFFSRAGTITFQ